MIDFSTVKEFYIGNDEVVGVSLNGTQVWVKKVAPPNDELWYETTNGQTANFSNTGFNTSIVSNTYSNGKGVVKFNANITSTTGTGGSASTATNLSKIWFPDSFTTVGDYSFFKCPLTQINLNNVTTIGYRAFDFNQVVTLNIPASLSSIANMGLRGMYLTNITVDPNNQTFTDGSSHNGSNCVYSGTTVVLGCINTVIPDNCTSIGQWAFSSNKLLTTLDLPATLTTLQGWAADFDTTEISNPALSTIYARSTPTFANSDVFDNQKTDGVLYYAYGVTPQIWLNYLPDGWRAERFEPYRVQVSNPYDSNGLVLEYSYDGSNYTQTTSFDQYLDDNTDVYFRVTTDAGMWDGTTFDGWDVNGSSQINNPLHLTVTEDTVVSMEVTLPTEDFQHTPFFVENPNNANISVQFQKTNSSAPTLTVEYSTDKTNWNSIQTSTSTRSVAVPANGRVYLRCNCNGWRDNSTGHSNNIHFSNNANIGGNVMSLIYGSNFTGNETTFKTNTQSVFQSLFANATYLISAENLIMPCTTLVNSCYTYMFNGCSDLTKAPELPATTLVTDCYSGMFNNCRSLVNAPELPATTLVTGCYNTMFYGCTSLNSIKVNFTQWKPSSGNFTYAWVTNVPSTGTFTKPSALAGTMGTNNIPNGWTIVNK